MSIQLTFDKDYKDYESEVKKLWTDINIIELFKKLNYNKILIWQDGPPFLSGSKDNKKTNLHSGTALISMIKSTLMTYYQMKKYKVEYWTSSDCHGFPSENFAMSMLNLSSPDDIKAYGLDKFNKYCKQLIIKYEKLWDNVYLSMGRHVDKTKHYRTMDFKYMESVIWSFKQLYNKGLIINGSKILPYSYGCQSSLSNFEAGENYQNINVESIYVKFPIVSDNKFYENVSFIVWTTTPWTIPSNISLCVNPDAIYVKIYTKNGIFIIQENSIKNFNNFNIEKVEIIGIGKMLEGLIYKPPYNYYSNYSSFKVVVDNFVTIGDINSSGVVHMSPFFGEDDFNVCVNNNIMNSVEILKLCPINDKCEFTDIISEFKGKLVFDINKNVINYLKITHLLIHTKQINHSYPYCPRTNTPLIYKACSGYFIDVPKLKNQIIELNENVNWFPKNIKSRFIEWMNNIKIWNISRSRFFGTPIPIWKSEDNSETIIIGSYEELESYTNEKITDFHPEFIDKITFKSSSGKIMKRIPYVFDCWYESGCSNFAQYHYPFENSNVFNNHECMADFAYEGIDQYSHWFYTMFVLSTAIFNKAPAKNLLCSGLILDKNGKKLSKSKGNFVDPQDIMNEYNSDSYRMYLLNSPVVEAENLKFDENHIKIMKQKLIQFSNSAIFFVEFYNAYIKQYKKFNYTLKLFERFNNNFDVWIISRIEELAKTINENLEVYKIKQNIPEIIEFIEDFTNYYIKLNRSRIKGIDGKQEQFESLSTSYYVIMKFIKLITPFTPFLSEYIFNKIKIIDIVNENYQSIKLCCYPQYDIHLINKFIIEQIKLFKKILILTRATRSKSEIIQSIRCPIHSITIYHSDKDFISFINVFSNIIKNEVNALYIKTEEINKYMKFQIIPNMKNIAKDYKLYMKNIKNIISNVSQCEMKNFYNKIIDKIICENIILTKEHIEIIPIIEYECPKNHVYSIDNNMLIDIDTEQTEEVINEYIVRQFIIHIQQKRKEMKLHIYDKININVSLSDDKYISIINNYQNKIINKLHHNINIVNNIITDKKINDFNNLELFSIGIVITFI
jgi:isoleucyl-tRNA synthetase